VLRGIVLRVAGLPDVERGARRGVCLCAQSGYFGSWSEIAAVSWFDACAART
jgi:hypothetical protein